MKLKWLKVDEKTKIRTLKPIEKIRHFPVKNEKLQCPMCLAMDYKPDRTIGN
jgi:hypothetical protein